MSVNSKMTAIADAIRAKTGETGLLTLDDMAVAVEGISGGVSLDVITAASLPAAVVENQIVVITSTTPGTIYVDTDEPANPVSGDVWVQVGSSNYGVEFSETFRNGLTWAVQHNGVGWDDVAGYVGTFGNWELFNTRLPAEYQEVEYIQSSGTQYIDTRFEPNNNTRVVMDITVLNGTVSSFFGARKGASESSFTAFCLDATSLRSDYGSSRQNLSINGVGSRVIVDANKSIFKYGSYSVSHAAATFNSTYSLYLLQNNFQGSADDNSCMAARLYSCQIYDNGTLVRDLVPCYRRPDNVAGLYDLVTQEFYSNAGEGAFIAGEAASPLLEQLQIIDILTGEVE